MECRKILVFMYAFFTRFNRDEIGPSGLCRRLFDGDISCDDCFDDSCLRRVLILRSVSTVYKLSSFKTNEYDA